jgi:hypothetical protein
MFRDFLMPIAAMTIFADIIDVKCGNVSKSALLLMHTNLS